MGDYIIMKTRIKELRLSKNLTQTVLAVIIGCSQNTISRIELEETIPSSEVLIELSDYFNVSIDYILYKTDHKNYTTIMSRADLPPRIAEYASKLRLLSTSDKDAIFAMIDYYSDRNTKK